MTVFSYTWDATFLSQPSDGEDINLGASRIRLFKSGLTERLQVDHSLAGDADDGKHNRITLKPAVGIPPVEADQGMVLNIVQGGISELYWLNDAGQLVRVTNQGGVNPDFPGNASVAGNLVTGTLQSLGNITALADTFLARNDPQFYETRDGGGNPIINFDVNTYIMFNRATDKFVFVVNSVEVASFPT